MTHGERLDHVALVLIALPSDDTEQVVGVAPFVDHPRRLRPQLDQGHISDGGAVGFGASDQCGFVTLPVTLPVQVHQREQPHADS